MYFQTNIGRNIADVPMRATAWDAFQGEVAQALNDLAIGLTGEGTTYEVHLSPSGSWEGDEESAHLSVFIPTSDVRTNGPETANVVVELRRELRAIAEWYCQDAIALIVSSALIAPPKSTRGYKLQAADRRNLL